MKTTLSIVLGILMLVGGINHIVAPQFYAEMIPGWVSADVANWTAAIVEIFIGVLMIVPKYRAMGAMSFALLMILFLPIHIWDLTKEVPAVGSFEVALVRLCIQPLLILAGFWIYSKNK